MGISSQLEAVATELPETLTPAREHLDLARKMARHSITEARRSIIDLRASVLEGQSLAAALRSGAQIWTAGSELAVDVGTPPPRTPRSPKKLSSICYGLHRKQWPMC